MKVKLVHGTAIGLVAAGVGVILIAMIIFLSWESFMTDTSEEATPVSAEEGLNEESLAVAYKQLADQFDEENGGFGEAPKFPSPHNLTFLLRMWRRTGDEKALAMVERTLQAMRYGGIYDHIGFGFHRYSTDVKWLVPHFEKMLYDQALIAMAYIEAYQATGEKDFRQTAKEIFRYVLRDMTMGDGGFYSAEDADSEGEEGKYYTWTPAQLKEALGEDASVAMKMLGIEEGERVVHLSEMPAKDDETWPRIRKRLREKRDKRVRPSKDDKVLTSWNGLMIAALAMGARVFDMPEYAEVAERAAQFLLQTMRDKDGRLMHRRRDGEVAVSGMANDYAFLIWGLIELYEATFEVRYLDAALQLNDQFIKHFWDEKGGGFFFTADDAEQLISRQKEMHDGAIPSANSVAMMNLLRLARLTGDAALEEMADRISMLPSSYAQMMSAVDFMIGPSYEVVIVGDAKADDTMKMLRALATRYIPNAVVLLRPMDEVEPAITRLASFTKDQKAIGGKATAYVCREHTCTKPTNEVKEMLEQMELEP